MFFVFNYQTEVLLSFHHINPPFLYLADDVSSGNFQLISHYTFRRGECLFQLMEGENSLACLFHRLANFALVGISIQFREATYIDLLGPNRLHMW